MFVQHGNAVFARTGEGRRHRHTSLGNLSADQPSICWRPVRKSPSRNKS